MFLFIDTSDNVKIHLALVQDNKIFSKKWNAPKSASEVLTQNIKKFLQSRKVNFSDIKKIGVGIGPGHFSRIRTGVATANALAYSLNVPIVPVASKTSVNILVASQKKGTSANPGVKPAYGKAPNISRPKKFKL